LLGARLQLSDRIASNKLVAFLTGDSQGAVSLLLSLRQGSISLRQELLGFLHLFRDRHAHLVNQVQDAILVDDDVVGEPDRPALVDDLFEAVY
jgi:hypothetical protein